MLNHQEIEQVIIDAKKKFQNIFSTVINGELFIWRLLSGIEYEIISKTSGGDIYIKEEIICQQAVIYPKVDFSLYKAGIPSKLAPQIIEESGFASKEKTQRFLDECRLNVFTRFQEQAYIVIASAFPQYSFEEMETWDIEKLIKMVARAEWKINVIDGKEFMFEKEEEQEEEQEEINEKEKLKELENEIINRGGDPIFTLYESTYKEHKEYMDHPFIMGNHFDREDVVNGVREKIQQRLLNTRRVL